jgi:hypothetical protein
MKKIVFAATAALFAIGSTAVLAQTPTPSTTPAPKVTAPMAKAPAAPTTTAAPKVAKTIGVPTTEIGKKCSADADAAGLKGKPRVAFRNKCKKDAAKEASAAKAAAKKN